MTPRRGLSLKPSDAVRGEDDQAAPIAPTSDTVPDRTRPWTVADVKAAEADAIARLAALTAAPPSHLLVPSAPSPQPQMSPPSPTATIARRTSKRPSKDVWVCDTRGHVTANSLVNIRHALTQIGVTVSHDAFAREYRINGEPIVDEIAFERVWVRIVDTCGWQPNRENLRAILLCDAQTTHPVRAYLEGLTWDGVPRLDRWLVTYAGAIDSAYVRAVSALPLLAAVRRVRQPGAKFDELLILESPQGFGKSSALRALCGDAWFSDDLPLGVETQRVIERTGGKWIIEAAELHGHRGRETDELKAFLSRQVDGPVRLAYARLPVSVPRQFVLVGTTNRGAHYLKDSTGARRFWPVSIGRFDVAALLRDRDQLWAEVAQREPYASIRLAEDLWATAAVEQEARRAPDPWEDVIEPLLSPAVGYEAKIALADVWKALGVEANRCSNTDADRVAAIMERRGYWKSPKDSAGYRFWVKRAPSTDADHDK